MGALKVTIQKFYRVNGGSTQYKGITPDIILPDTMGYAKNREQDLDYSLTWDKVPMQKFNKWNGPFFNLNDLRGKSKKRMKSSKNLQKIKGSVDYLISKREDTIVSLNEKKVKEEDKKNKDTLDKFKIEDQNKSILVANFEDALSEDENIKKQNKKKWKEDVEQRSKDWEEGIQKDGVLEETLFIMNDMIKVASKKYFKEIKDGKHC